MKNHYSGLELQGTTQAYRKCLHHNLAFLFAVVQLLHLIKRMNDTTLAQLVKASVGQADVQRFEPRLGITC